MTASEKDIKNKEEIKTLLDASWEPERVAAHGDLTSLAPHERLPEILVVPREKTPTGAAARGDRKSVV